MLGTLCARPKACGLSAQSFTDGATYSRLTANQVSFLSVLSEETHRRDHSSACRIGTQCGGGAASIWHAIFPSASQNLVVPFHHDQKGEGSWNAAWDVRPARWLHGSDSAWLLFGVCACFAPFDWRFENFDSKKVDSTNSNEGILRSCLKPIEKDGCSHKYRVIGVPGDGRCLFRALSYGGCLKCAEELPDENRQRELADDLRARVADELLKRREETEWFIEGDFDAYVKSIQQPNAWGGEPELLMASHIFRMPISVFMIDRCSRDLKNIANYGREYGKDESPIQVVFHGYGHYDVLEIFPDKTNQKKEL